MELLFRSVCVSRFTFRTFCVRLPLSFLSVSSRMNVYVCDSRSLFKNLFAVVCLEVWSDVSSTAVCWILIWYSSLGPNYFFVKKMLLRRCPLDGHTLDVTLSFALRRRIDVLSKYEMLDVDLWVHLGEQSIWMLQCKSSVWCWKQFNIHNTRVLVALLSSVEQQVKSWIYSIYSDAQVVEPLYETEA